MVGIAQYHQGRVVGRVYVALLQQGLKRDEGDPRQDHDNADRDYQFQEREAALLTRLHEFLSWGRSGGMRALQSLSRSLKVASVNDVPNFSVVVHFRNALERDQSTKGPRWTIGLLASRGSLSS